MRRGDEDIVKEMWHEMLVEYKAFAHDTGKYNTRLRQDARPTGALFNDLEYCAQYLVAISRLWGRAFFPEEVRVERQRLRHLSDVWVGVINTSQRTSRYDLWLDGTQHTFSLRPGEHQLLLGTNAIPAIPVQYGEQQLHATSPPYVMVHCHLNEWFRRRLASDWWVVDGVTISNGVTGEPKSKHHELPGVEEPWQEKARSKSEWLDVVREELMRVSCHPSRLEQIGV